MAASNHENLLQVAIDLFSLQGYDGVSIRQLTRAVGIKESSFYNHFSSKEELLKEILALFRERYLNTMPPEETLEQLLPAREPREFLEAGARLFVTVMSDPQMKKLNRILSLEQYRNPYARQIILEDVIERPLRYTQRIFERYIALGKLPAVDALQAARSYQLPMYALLIQFLILDAAGEDTTAVIESVRDHIHFYFEHLIQGIAS